MTSLASDFPAIAEALRRLRADSPVPPAKQGCKACDWNGWVWRWGHTGGLGKEPCVCATVAPAPQPGQAGGS